VSEKVYDSTVKPSEQIAKIEVLLVGLDEKSHEFINDIFRQSNTDVHITAVYETNVFENSYEAWNDGMYSIVICGNALKDIPGSELAQVFLNQCPDTKRYFVTSVMEGFQPRLLLKNGFMQAYALPQDESLVRDLIADTLTTGKKVKRVYRPIKVVDLEEGGTLDFSTYVFLPLNRRHVPFSAVNTELSKKKIEMLQNKQVGQVYIDTRDMPKFYQYTAQKLQGVDSGNAITATEKQERVSTMVRGLFSDIFDSSVKGDFETGREMAQHAEKIVSNFVTKGTSSNWYKKLMSAVGESHDASSVSTFAALFAIGIGHPRPADLAMAGLFHDLGMTNVPAHIAEKKTQDMKPDELRLYSGHPEMSVNSLKGKRMIISPEVEKAILQHHERFDGKGFPKGYSTNKIFEDAQILSFADQFDYLTRIEDGKVRMTPLEAWKEIRDSASISYDLLGRIRKLLEQQKP
jgi:HD-GYP domain-containing protein (c-di-GMP phosphodiesterase class II)